MAHEPAMRGHSIGQREQSAQLTQLRRDDPRMASVYRELEDAGLHRLELAFWGVLPATQETRDAWPLLTEPRPLC